MSDITRGKSSFFMLNGFLFDFSVLQKAKIVILNENTNKKEHKSCLGNENHKKTLRSRKRMK